MVPDYARAALGVGCTGAPVLLADLPALATTALSALVAIFGLFAMQVGLKHRTRILMNDQGIRALPLGRLLDWNRLSRMSLAYFSVRRDGREGWMELKLTGDRGTLRIDSRLEGFADVVRRAVSAAGGASLHLDPTTLSNLSALGIAAVGGEGGMEES
jgi:hypothetical protein